MYQENEEKLSSIRAIDICVGYDEQVLINNVSLTLAPKQTVVITGEIGSGKSTLLKVLGLLVPPLSGKIYLGELDCYDLNPSEMDVLIQQYMAYIFQKSKLMMDWTARENIELTMIAKGYSKRYANKEINLYAKALDIKKLIDSKIPLRGLSGGERQLVSIMRALVKTPRRSTVPFFLIADEPTNHLDDDRAEQVIERLIDIAKSRQYNMSLIMATHDQEILGLFDHQFKIEQRSLIKFQDQ